MFRERGIVWEWETTTSAVKNLYTPDQLVGKCTRTFDVAFGALTKTTQNHPPGDVVLHRLMVGLPRSQVKNSAQIHW